MEQKKRLHRIEYLVYAILLLIILLAPTVSTLFHGHEIDDTEFLWHDLLNSWKAIIVYVIAFAIHDVFIAPLLVYKHKPWYYFLGVVALACVFMLYQCNGRPSQPPRILNESMNRAGKVSPKPSEIDFGAKMPPAPPGEKMKPVAPPPIRRHDIISMVLFLFGIGTNIGIKFYFLSIGARKQLEELEKENLKQSLVQLRYQLHPHFFMNTLNNIHALVDIDPVKAQKCIIDLSKLMRYILYESDHEYVPAYQEVEFMENYVRLMRIRFNDKLRFTVNNNDDGKGIWIPPLIFISFVENAFKHGVCPNKESFIDIKSHVYTNENGEPRLQYTCRNSKHIKSDSAKAVNEASGVGLSNIKGRLDLMFVNNYTLTINDGVEEYAIEMDIPVKTSAPS